MKTLNFISTRIASFSLGLACLALPGVAGAAPDAMPPVSSPPSAGVPSLPFGVTEVVKMYQGGINKDVILNYVQNTALPFHLTADGIIYLNHLGVPQDVISAVIHRDGQLHEQAALAYQQQSLNAQEQQMQQQQMAGQQQPQPYPSGAGGGNAVVTPSTPPPPVYGDGTDVVPDYSGYPYDYGSYYWPPVVVGGYGWGPGWGWGGGWGRGGFGRGFGGFGHGGFGHGGFGGGFGHGGFGGGGFHGGGGGFHGGGGGGHGGGGHR